MNFKNLVRASAQVVTVTELAKGDAIKVIEEDSYSGAKVRYGIVIDVLNEGEKGYVQAIMLKSEYRSISKEIVLISEKKMEGMAIFPSSLEEIKASFSECLESFEKAIAEAVTNLDKMRNDLAFAKRVISGAEELQGNVPKFTVSPRLTSDNSAQ